MRRFCHAGASAILIGMLMCASAFAQQKNQGPPNALQGFSQNRDEPVKIQAASVNTLDLAMRGPFLGRIITGGLLKPKDPRLGADIAGRVEAVGSNVTQFQPGDEVFGAYKGGFAEYVSVPERAP